LLHCAYRGVMRALGNHLGARTISLALVAGLVAFEAALVLGAGAVAAVEPYRPDGEGGAAADVTASFPPTSAPAMPSTPSMLVALPVASAVQGWVKAKATEIKGEERSRAPYHFEFWLELPEEMKRRLVAVAYDFNTPAVMPQSQVSSEEKTGFRVSAGGLVCADKVTVTLQFNDGRSQQVAVDGCRLLG